ncbi:MAG: DNA polymerase III subunit delta [Streptococcaceae bacterium]|jgi:DNA polymerase-3 subunit delta|nr:DNA polymerase III subunit delta [Streptococcaceae bacterium]
MKVIDQINQALQQNQLNFFFYGNNSFYLDYLLKHFTKVVARTIDDTETMHLNMEKISFQNLFDELNTLPFFAEKKLVILENMLDLTAKNKAFLSEDERHTLINYLKQPNPTTIFVILIHGNADKRKKFTKEINKLSAEVKAEITDDQEISQFLTQLNSQQATPILTPAQIHLVASLSNFQLELAVNNFTQLSALAETKVITDELIRNNQIKDLTQNVFDLSKFIIKGQVGETFLLYNDLMKVAKSGELIKINGILIAQFRFLLTIQLLKQQGYSLEQMAERMKTLNGKAINPNRIRFAIRDLKQISLEFLVASEKILIETDYLMKSSAQDSQLLFETMLLKLNDLATK